MIDTDSLAMTPAALADVKAFLRVEGAREDALITGVIGSAADLCEQFTGEMLLQRNVRERLPAAGSWTRLGRRPVRSVESVAGVVDGLPSALPAGAYSIDIDASGAGWVRVTAPAGAKQVLVTYRCGLAAEWGDIAEPLRHGIIRLAAHLYTHRSGADDPGPPAAVTALWRPYRRLRLA